MSDQQAWPEGWVVTRQESLFLSLWSDNGGYGIAVYAWINESGKIWSVAFEHWLGKPDARNRECSIDVDWDFPDLRKSIESGHIAETIREWVGFPPCAPRLKDSWLDGVGNSA